MSDVVASTAPSSWYQYIPVFQPYSIHCLIIIAHCCGIVIIVNCGDSQKHSLSTESGLVKCIVIVILH